MMNDEIQNEETQTEEIQTGAEEQEPEQETPAEEPAAAEETTVVEEAATEEESAAESTEKPAAAEEPAAVEEPAAEAPEQPEPVETPAAVEEVPAAAAGKPAKKAEKAPAATVKTDPIMVIKRAPRERAESEATGEAAKEDRGRRKVRVGRVVSDKMDKTVVVAVQRNMRHPLYGKIVRRTKKYKAHDERNDCHVGDMVEIIETRPISREKRWRVRSVVERAK